MFTVKPEIVVAQLSIVDGAWQESPDNVATFDEASLFGDGLARGSLYVAAEVAGEPEGRDELARELIETVRREYATSRGSIALGLIQAVRAANQFFYTRNASAPPEARRIAGVTAAIVRDDELFLAQGGPGLTCLVRGSELRRFPDTSPWFDSEGRQVYDDEFTTPGTIPLGKRRNYTPDQFHVTLQPGDIVVLATRSLVHLLTNEELLDTLARRHPDEIVASLEDLAGASDLSVIALRIAGESTAPFSTPSRAAIEPSIVAPTVAALPQEEEIEPIAAIVPPPSLLARPAAETERAAEIERTIESPRVEPPEALPVRRHARGERTRDLLTKIRTAFLHVSAGIVAALAGVLGRINWTGIGTAADRAIGTILRSVARILVFLIRAVVPGEPKEPTPARNVSAPKAQTAWQLAALVFPILLIAAGGGMWINYRVNQQRLAAIETQKQIDDSTKALESAKRLAITDRNAARESAQKAMDSAQKVLSREPTNQVAHKAYNDASDWLDQFNGVAVLFTISSFATFSDERAQPSRIVTHYPDVFILDRGTQHIYRYAVTETVSSAMPVGTDGVILRAGDRPDNRPINQLVDMMWIDSGRLVALERSGLFLQYDPARSQWGARAALDGTGWTRVNLAASYGTNLYLADASRNQILKYVATTEGWWTSSVTYFVPGVNPDLSNLVDLTLDENVWLLRGDGSIFRYTMGRPNDLQLRELDKPLSQPAAISTSPTHVGFYIADAGNQRIVQIDKTTGRFVRQFKPSAQHRDVFKSLKTLTVDEANKKFYFISGNQAYLATIPQ